MAQDKDERAGIAPRRTEVGDDSTRRAPGTPGRPGPRESAGGANGGELAATLPGKRREHYIIGTRTPPDGQLFGPEQAHSMDEVVEYLVARERPRRVADREAHAPLSDIHSQHATAHLQML
jgi:hypothetical protein